MRVRVRVGVGVGVGVGVWVWVWVCGCGCVCVTHLNSCHPSKSFACPASNLNLERNPTSKALCHQLKFRKDASRDRDMHPNKHTVKLAVLILVAQAGHVIDDLLPESSGGCHCLEHFIYCT